MGLDFTSIKDAEGATVYLIHDGKVTQRRELEKITAFLQGRTPPVQAVLLSAHEADGRRICEFYGLRSDSFPHIIVVRDNDQLLQHWSGLQLPTAEVIAYTVSGMHRG